jgi:iron complex outermembrane receptor protein
VNVKLLLAGVAAGAIQAPLLAQDAPPPADPHARDAGTAAAPAPAGNGSDDRQLDDGDGEEIVVTGARERGAVIGDIPPDIQLDRRGIRAYGASSMAELIDALAPQTRSGRGRGGEQPVTLLNGRRISSFSEIRDIPPEAIDRIDILPEEVALKYGYRADQRVVNIVLRRRFRAVTGELEGGLATDGGRASYGTEATMLRIDQAGRYSLHAEYQHADVLLESERGIVQPDPLAPIDAGRFRSLLAETDRLTLNGNVNRTVFGNVSATLNARFDANSSLSFLGRRGASGDIPLTRDSDTLAGHLGLALNGDIAPWRWSATANYDRSGTETLTGTNAGSDRAQTLSDTATAQLVANGPLFDLPAGSVSTSLRAGFDALGLHSETVRAGVGQARDLTRQRGSVLANLDVPIASRRRGVLSAIGDLSLNLNAELEHFSDFGMLRTLGGGVTWSPVKQLDLIASMTDEDGAPSMQQLGDPVLVTPNVRVFDFVRNETVEISRIDGGNPNLVADNRRVFKLGATLKPFDKPDLSISANYTSSRILNPIASFPTATPEIEAAFPDRFTRDASGRLARIDNRPVNFARSDREELRWGVNLTLPVGPQPAPGAFRRGGGPGGPGGPGGARRPGEGGGPRGPGAGGGGGGGRGGFGGFGGGGRLLLSLYHNWRITDTILIRDGLPRLDLLNGSAVGSRGGQPRHELEFQAALFRNGLGALLTAERRRRIGERPPFLRLHDPQPQPVRRSRPAKESGARASLAARRANQPVGRQSAQ